ncbi:hypothetical protein CDAR_187991 [Caerostris darwini]|uniref:Uncharacterized protein n=1 Tax=Caerostris darwini TaxID=1538125 RepID=A0AAV4SLC7_9ARAC|nr:hypothetical protein CDAR_187991 [Caerostris darwini]
MQSPLIRSVQIRALCQGSYRFARAYHWRAVERRHLPSAVPNVDFYYFANGRALILADDWARGKGGDPGFMLGSAWRTALRWVCDKYWDRTPVTRGVCFRKDLCSNSNIKYSITHSSLQYRVLYYTLIPPVQSTLLHTHPSSTEYSITHSSLQYRVLYYTLIPPVQSTLLHTHPSSTVQSTLLHTHPSSTEYSITHSSLQYRVLYYTLIPPVQSTLLHTNPSSSTLV